MLLALLLLAQGPGDARTFHSPSGEWALDVVPVLADGRGPARYQLFRHGARVWQRTLEFPLLEAVLTDDGLAFGHGWAIPPNSGCGLHIDYLKDTEVYPIGVVLPDGNGVILAEPLLRHRPRGFQVEKGHRLVFRALGESFDFGPMPRVPAPEPSGDPGDLDALNRSRRAFPLPEPTDLELELRASVPLRSVRLPECAVDPRGLLVVVDPFERTVTRYDTEGRALERRPFPESWKGRPERIDVDPAGAVRAVYYRGVFDLVTGERVPRAATTLYSAKRSAVQWFEGRRHWIRVAPGLPNHSIRHAPTGEALGFATAAVGPRGELVILDYARDPRRLLVYTAEAEPLRTLSTGGHPTMVDTDGEVALWLDGEDEFHLTLLTLDGTNALRARVAHYGYPFFSPDGDELWLFALGENQELAFERYRRPR